MKKTLSIILMSILILSACHHKEENQETIKTTEKPENTQIKTNTKEITKIYAIDQENSRIKWTGTNSITKKEHSGTIKIQQGTVIMKNNDLADGGVTIDMTSINSTDQENEKSKQNLDKQLKSDDFFAVETYPEAKFIITNVIPEIPGNLSTSTKEYEIWGNLTIKGLTKGIKIPAQATLVNKQIMASSIFQVDRTEWGVIYGSGKFFKSLGDAAIDDMIIFDISIIANKKS